MKLQALKLRELMHDEFRKTTIKKNFDELDRLASSPRIQAQAGKLEERRSVMNKYGRLPLKPGFNKRQLDYKDKLTMLDI